MEPVRRNRLLTEIQPDELRSLAGKIVDRVAPATAIHARDSVKQIFGFAILHGEKVANPVDSVGPAAVRDDGSAAVGQVASDGKAARKLAASSCRINGQIPQLHVGKPKLD